MDAAIRGRCHTESRARTTEALGQHLIDSPGVVRAPVRRLREHAEKLRRPGPILLQRHDTAPQLREHPRNLIVGQVRDQFLKFESLAGHVASLEARVATGRDRNG